MAALPMLTAVATDVKRPEGYGQGRMLPAWLDTRDPEAARGSARVRSVDPNLIVGMDTRRRVLMIWGPSLALGGWAPICDCQDDEGNPFRGVVPWDLICAGLIAAREGPTSAERVRDAEERRERHEADERERRVREGARYFARGIAGEVGGWGRWSAEDIERGWNSRWV